MPSSNPCDMLQICHPICSSECNTTCHPHFLPHSFKGPALCGLFNLEQTDSQSASGLFNLEQTDSQSANLMSNQGRCLRFNEPQLAINIILGITLVFLIRSHLLYKPPRATPTHKCFPYDFEWGVATAAYQVEGASTADDRGRSIWDEVCQPKSPWHGKLDAGVPTSPGQPHPTAVCADMADNMRYTFEQDLDVMRNLGAQFYRFSISWNRVMTWDPRHKRMVPNPRGIAYYHQLFRAMSRRAIRPAVTMYHWWPLPLSSPLPLPLLLPLTTALILALARALALALAITLPLAVAPGLVLECDNHRQLMPLPLLLPSPLPMSLPLPMPLLLPLPLLPPLRLPHFLYSQFSVHSTFVFANSLHATNERCEQVCMHRTQL